MKTTEELMVESLGDNFFWAPNAKDDRDYIRDAKVIVKAQKVWRREKKPGKVVPEIIKAPKTDNLMEKIRFLQCVVAKAHAVDSGLIISKSRPVHVANARHHFLWSLIRYFPEISLFKMGQIIGRHHSTLIHSRDLFAKIAQDFSAQISVVDKAMGYEESKPS